MKVGTDYADDLKCELLAEMAGNFFSRRCRLDQRLEAFTGLCQTVAKQGERALTRWRAFHALLLGDGEADRFLEKLGFAVATLATFPQSNAPCPHGRRPLALTAAGRYTKTVLAAYERLRQDLEKYNEGGYAPDPRDPRRMIHLPGYRSLLATAKALNAEIESVNACQCPSDMLQFTKGLDPVRQEQERACGGIAMGNSGHLDRDMAFKPIDVTALGVPSLPTPPPLETVEDELAALAGRLHSTAPDAANAAMAALWEKE